MEKSHDFLRGFGSDFFCYKCLMIDKKPEVLPRKAVSKRATNQSQRSKLSGAKSSTGSQQRGGGNGEYRSQPISKSSPYK